MSLKRSGPTDLDFQNIRPLFTGLKEMSKTEIRAWAFLGDYSQALRRLDVLCLPWPAQLAKPSILSHRWWLGSWCMRLYFIQSMFATCLSRPQYLQYRHEPDLCCHSISISHSLDNTIPVSYWKPPPFLSLSHSPWGQSVSPWAPGWRCDLILTNP